MKKSALVVRNVSELAVNISGLPGPGSILKKEKAFKCHLCFGDPQCVKLCPFGALKMERSEKGFLVGFPVIKED